MIQKLKPKGTICDLGCGTGHKLMKICQATRRPGLGIDIDNDAFVSDKSLSVGGTNISLELGDVAKLDGVWEDIDIVLQSFVAHGFFPDDRYVSILASYQNNFPHMKYFVIVDIVSPDDSLESFMPGYDYVHGLLGLETRSHERTVKLFTNAGYEIAKQVSVPSLPNTFIWILKVKR
jgi:cyclopropane fatty-acyl-phospholipid synthase-like methyltransferase